MPPPQQAEGGVRTLVAATESPAETAARPDISPAEAARIGRADEAAAEIPLLHGRLVGKDAVLLGRPGLRLLVRRRLHVVEQCVEALVIALDLRSGPLQLEQARHHFQCQKRHGGYPCFAILARRPNRTRRN